MRLTLFAVPDDQQGSKALPPSGPIETRTARAAYPANVRTPERHAGGLRPPWPTVAIVDKFQCFTATNADEDWFPECGAQRGL